MSEETSVMSGVVSFVISFIEKYNREVLKMIKETYVKYKLTYAAKNVIENIKNEGLSPEILRKCRELGCEFDDFPEEPELQKYLLQLKERSHNELTGYKDKPESELPTYRRKKAESLEFYGSDKKNKRLKKEYIPEDIMNRYGDDLYKICILESMSKLQRRSNGKKDMEYKIENEIEQSESSKLTKAISKKYGKDEKEIEIHKRFSANEIINVLEGVEEDILDILYKIKNYKFIKRKQILSMNIESQTKQENKSSMPSFTITITIPINKISLF